MKAIKCIAIAVAFVLPWSCGGNGSKKNNALITASKDCLVAKEEIIEKWFVYERPINSYDVKIHWQCNKSQLFTGTGCFYFSNADTTKTLAQAIDLDGWFDEKMLMEMPDTIVLDEYYTETTHPYLDWRTIVGFADYDFDGEKELVICGSPRPNRDLDADDWLDCEDFTFYKDSPEGFMKMGDEPFDILSTGTCRTYCKFDTCQKTILLLTSGGACCSDSMTYYFQDGLPFKSVEVRHEQLADTTINETIVLYYSYD